VQQGSTGGPVIENTVLNTIGNSLADAILLKKITIDELTLARFEIESLILKHVIDNYNVSDIESLKGNIAQAKKTQGSN